MTEMTVRFAEERDLPAVNVLRREVNDLHVAGRPETFKPGFSPELENYLFEIWRDPARCVVVAEEDGTVCGFAVLREIHKPEDPFKREDWFLDVDELGVAASHRRRGVGTALISFIRAYARERGFNRLELNMWEFNREALAFYETVGFSTYRRYLEIKL
jgi:ribosomal protein S18 acetylase RimI-like enzyme